MDRKVILESGDILYRQGDSNKYAYIIESGEVLLYTVVNGQRVDCERRGPGAVIGELSIMTDQCRSVTVEAVTPCRLYQMPAKQILSRFGKLDPVLRACVDTSINFQGTLNKRMNDATGPLPTVANTLQDVTSIIDRFKMESDIHAGIERDEFSLIYQPIVTIADGEAVGVEALMRWQHPECGNIPPFRFIAIAEEIGIIGKLTEFALSEACAALMRIRAHCPEKPDFYTSVNISGKDVERDDFVDFVAHILDRHGMNPAHLKLEVTETSLVADPVNASRRLAQLRELGCGISIDDFGTGYSSLAYLKTLPLTTLKIDRAFAGDAHANTVSRSIVELMVGLGRKIGADVVAEGLETSEDVATLRAMGCIHAQGYYFSKPVAEVDLLKFMGVAEETIARVA